MFKNIKKWIFRSNNNTQMICSINFEINYDGTITIICYWPNFDDSNIDKMDMVSSEFGALLYALDNGLMKKNIIDTLTNLSRPNNMYDSLFVNLSLKKWIEAIEKNEPISSNSEPIVKPSSVFNR